MLFLHLVLINSQLVLSFIHGCEYVCFALQAHGKAT